MAKLMRARRLRTRLQFYRPVEDVSPTGNVELGWALHCECWAEFIPTRGRELMEAGRLEPQVPATVRIRFNDTTKQITAAFRAGQAGPEMAVVSVIAPDQHDRTVELILMTGKPG